MYKFSLTGKEFRVGRSTLFMSTCVLLLKMGYRWQHQNLSFYQLKIKRAHVLDSYHPVHIQKGTKKKKKKKKKKK